MCCEKQLEKTMFEIGYKYCPYCGRKLEEPYSPFEEYRKVKALKKYIVRLANEKGTTYLADIHRGLFELSVLAYQKAYPDAELNEENCPKNASDEIRIIFNNLKKHFEGTTLDYYERFWVHTIGNTRG